MILTADNYYSNEADKCFMSVSQFKDFMSCEAHALAKLNGEIPKETSKAMLVGNFIHSFFESKEEHQKFVKENDETIFNSKGNYYADFEKASEMIKKLENDDFFKFVYQGDKEEIVTGELYGVEWKAKIDLVNFEKGYFVDLKTTREMAKRYWSDKFGMYVPFVLAYDYVLQMYVYKKLLEQNHKQLFTPYIFAVSKESPVNIKAISIEPSRFLIEEEYIKENIERIAAVKNGELEPRKCGKCHYCVARENLTGFIEIDELFE